MCMTIGWISAWGVESISIDKNTSFFFFFSSRRRHTRCSRDWSSDVCSSDLRQPDLREFSKPCPQVLVRKGAQIPEFLLEMPALHGKFEIKFNHLPQQARKRSEEHTSELQSRLHLVCRLLLEKKNLVTHRVSQ